jgi:RTX calcium-binding nonapeptide repeat (4 copies)
MAVVRLLLMGCAVLLFVGCAGDRSEAPEEQGHTEATEREARAPEATTEEDRCEGTRTFRDKTTNDVPGCPKGGLLFGTDDKDFLDGKKGDDEIRGLRGRGDKILGGAGNDIIYGGPDNEALLDRGPGDANESWLDGQGGDDVIYAGDGDDRFIWGAAGDDVIYGGDGNDQMFGDDVTDEGQDVLHGGDGNDQLGGDKGQDVLHGGDGNDHLDGSDGRARFVDRERDELYCGKGMDEYIADRLDYVDSSCEKEVKPDPPPSGCVEGNC